MQAMTAEVRMSPAGEWQPFDERVKIHDLEGVDGVLRRRGYPSVESLKARTAKKAMLDAVAPFFDSFGAAVVKTSAASTWHSEHFGI
jgi:hypothetical protein